MFLTRRMIPIGALAALALALQPIASAKVARAPLEELIQSADLIVIGTDSAIERRGKWNIARFQVEEVLKGQAPTKIQYLASPTWTCDITSAKQGERALLLLTLPGRGRIAPPRSHRGSTVYQILFSGRGRMPIDEVDGDLQVTVWTVDVVLPADMPTSEGPEPQFDFIRRVPLTAIRQTIEQQSFKE